MGYLEIAVIAIAAMIGIPILRRRLQKARVERLHRKYVADGYVLVSLYEPFGIPGFALDELFSTRESRYVHTSAIEPFVQARARGLEECNRLLAEAWNRFASGQLESGAYVEQCQLCIASYAQIGGQLERRAVASGLEPKTAAAVRRQFYNYDFPDPRLEMLKTGIASRLAVFRIDDGLRAPQGGGRQERPMKDVTPPKPQLRGGRTYH